MALLGVWKGALGTEALVREPTYASGPTRVYDLARACALWQDRCQT